MELFTGFFDGVYRTLAYGRAEMLMRGMWVTIQLSAGAITLGLLIGIIVVTFKLSRFKALRAAATTYLAIIRGTPAMTQLLIVHSILFGALGNRLWVAIVALGINSGAYVAEIIRAGILSIDKGQTEAGLTLGLSRWQTMAFIVMPQAVKNILPTFINEFIVLIKETAIVGIVAVPDLTRTAQQIVARTFDATPYFVVAAMYFTLIFVLTFLLNLLEKRLRASDRG